MTDSAARDAAAQAWKRDTLRLSDDVERPSGAGRHGSPPSAHSDVHALPANKRGADGHRTLCPVRQCSCRIVTWEEGAEQMMRTRCSRHLAYKSRSTEPERIERLASHKMSYICVLLRGPPLCPTTGTLSLTQRGRVDPTRPSSNARGVRVSYTSRKP